MTQVRVGPAAATRRQVDLLHPETAHEPAAPQSEALALRVPQTPRLYPAGVADRNGDDVALVCDVDLRAPGRQPFRDERGNHRHRAALLPAADRLQLPALVGGGLLVDIEAAGGV